jgi:hypothetical protein
MMAALEVTAVEIYGELTLDVEAMGEDEPHQVRTRTFDRLGNILMVVRIPTSWYVWSPSSLYDMTLMPISSNGSPPGLVPDQVHSEPPFEPSSDIRCATS